MAENTTPAVGEMTSPQPEQPPSGEPRLRMHGISKSFGAVRALYKVDFEVHDNEVVGLVGDNGAGKSTLIKVISGVGPSDEGEIFLGGKEVHITSPQAANRLGIETVYQDLALCDNLDVVANLFLGREERSFLRSLNEIDMEKQTLTVLRTLDVKLPSTRTAVATLSGGQRQSVAVAKSILRKAKVVLLDEPTAALGVAQTRQVLHLIRRLRDQGLAVVVISHNLADVFEVVDRVVVMRLGRRVGTFDIKTTTPEQIVASITGAEFGVIMVLLLGEIDLSIASVSVFCSVVMAILSERYGMNALVAILAALLTGAIVGLINGFFVAIVRVPSFIVTLAASIFYSGLLLNLLAGQSTLIINSPFIVAIAGSAESFLPNYLGIGLPLIAVLLYAISLISGYVRRKRAGLRTMTLLQVVLQIVVT